MVDLDRALFYYQHFKILFYKLLKLFNYIFNHKKLINQMHLYKYSNFIYDKINNIFAASAIFNIDQNYINYKFFYAYS